MRKHVLAFLLVILLGGTAWAADSKPQIFPDPNLTPGAVDPDIQPIEICSTSTSERRSVSTSLKKQVFAAYHIPWSEHSKYEVDHFIPLALGGVNSCPENPTCNLWPQPRQKNFADIAPWGAETKDRLELKLYRMMCADDVTLQEAQDAIRSDWTKAFQKYIGNPQR